MLSCVQLFCDPIDCILPGSSVHGICQARILEWVAISFSRGSSQPRGQTQVSIISCASRQILYHGATKEAQMVKMVDYFLCFTTIENNFKRKENEGPNLVTGTRRSLRGLHSYLCVASKGDRWFPRERGCSAQII